MVEVETVLSVVPALSVVAALLYYALTIRNTDKIRRKDFIFQSNLARTPEYYTLFGTVSQMWDYDTREEYYKKYRREQRSKHNYSYQHFNTIGVLYKEKVASSDIILQMYPPSVVIHLFELSWPLIRDSRVNTGDTEFMKPFELLYMEARRRLPAYIPEWQKGLRSTRAIHP